MGLNLVSNDVDATEIYASSVESVLSLADEPVTTLRDRVLLALRYSFSWLQALDPGVAVVLETAAGSYDPIAAAQFVARIRDMQTALRALLDLMPPDSGFVGKDVKVQYEAVSAAWAQLYRDLSTSLTGYPQRPLLDQVGDIGRALLDAPVAAVSTIAEQTSSAIARLLGNTAGAIWSNLWPWLLVAGALGIAYVFHKPLLAAVKKVSG